MLLPSRVCKYSGGLGGWGVSWATSLLDESPCFYLCSRNVHVCPNQEAEPS